MQGFAWQHALLILKMAQRLDWEERVPMWGPEAIMCIRVLCGCCLTFGEILLQEVRIIYIIYTNLILEHVCKMRFEEATLPAQQVLIAQWATCLGTTSNGDVCCLSPVEIDMQMYFSMRFFLIDNRYPSYVSLEIYLCVWIMTWFMIHLRSYHYILCTSICYMLLFHWIAQRLLYLYYLYIYILVLAAEDNMSS